MTAAQRAWQSAGRPWKLARPIADLAAILRRYGYTVGTIGNSAHMAGEPPEDHTPFSASGWPSANVFPYVCACDIMPPTGKDLPPLAALGAQLISDRNAGLPAVAWIKYLNWTNAAGRCRHESWQPAYSSRISGDVGHIHVSCRTDFTFSPAAASYDPVARVRTGLSSAPAGLVAPPYPGTPLSYAPNQHLVYSSAARAWQARMRERRYAITVDGLFGPASAMVCKAFQSAHVLVVDGIVGPLTWAASWRSD